VISLLLDNGADIYTKNQVCKYEFICYNVYLVRSCVHLVCRIVYTVHLFEYTVEIYDCLFEPNRFLSCENRDFGAFVEANSRHHLVFYGFLL
jgi:hypothetical protein